MRFVSICALDYAVDVSSVQYGLQVGQSTLVTSCAAAVVFLVDFLKTHKNKRLFSVF